MPAMAGLSDERRGGDGQAGAYMSGYLLMMDGSEPPTALKILGEQFAAGAG